MVEWCVLVLLYGGAYAVTERWLGGDHSISLETYGNAVLVANEAADYFDAH